MGELARYCKRELRLPFVSVITNGSLVTRDWLRQYRGCLDVLGVSCDSFDEATNIALGRTTARTGSHLARVRQLARWCAEERLPLKLNTVITALNAQEDMRAAVAELAPVRCKIFQLLQLRGENTGAGALRDAAHLAVDDAAFAAFVQRHVAPDGRLRTASGGTAAVTAAAVEGNAAMQSSYLLLDERMRFLDCSAGGKAPGPSLLDVGVAAAVRHAGFDEAAFLARGGDWAL